MSDVGFVLFKRGDESGTLEATWCHSSQGYGIGKATCGPPAAFVGRYDMHYPNRSDSDDVHRELEIQREGLVYQLSWFHDGELRATGVGMEVADGLAAGWRGVDDM